MSKNIIYCVLGTVLGFSIGFFIANTLTRPGVQVASSARAPESVPRPLGPEQMGGALPPGHPEVADAAPSGGVGAAAATSPEAQTAMEQADRSPQDFDAQLKAARVFYGLHDYAKAALYGERAVRIRPKDFEALVLLGNTKYDEGDFVAAAPFYERALEIKPDSPDVRTDFGNTFFNRRPPDFNRAIAEYRKSVAVDPRHENSWKNIAAAALNLRDKATAGEAIERLAALNPQYPELADLRQKLEAIP